MLAKELIGVCAGILTASSLVPQFIKSLKEKKVDGVTPFLFIVLLAGNGLWMYYGILLKDIPIIATNSFSIIMDVAMLILKFRYRKK
ncbi:SemiSWEET family sugar transporter [Hufsiella ginkgonis]|uniref:MtN3 and saliva related transmembrane protein n=1 Tax=Hufsiella ginkgonis TaxID=2695274 RepID=A0A7K1Y0C2_9SPHI|nr:lipid-A-disaccharide synthase N-terminal domain-containing protein [Hufsiella ginkgonis]MXV16724.1 hypothetical protein [Hufsiella ginkgonis]